MDEVQPDFVFVEAVRARLDASLTAAGLPFNGVYPGSGPLGDTTAVLYEATADEFLTRFPGLTTNWAPDWPEHTSCVDLWITLRHDDGTMAVALEGLDLVALAGRCGDHLLVEACARALTQRGDIVERVDMIGQVLDAALV